MYKTTKLITAGLTAALGTLLAAPAFANADRDGANREMVIDYSSRPPYQRTYKKVSSEADVDFARFEEQRAVSTPAVGEKITVVDTTGRPPYQRRVVEINESNATDFARFEEVSSNEPERVRVGPPGKNFWQKR